MRDFRPLVFVSALLLFSACSKSSSTQPEGAAVKEGATSGVTLTQVLNQTLAAADVLLAQQDQVDESLKRQQAKMKGARVERRLPAGGLDGAAIRGVLTAYAKMHGLGDVQVKLAPAESAEPLPETHGGQEPYAFTTKQLVGSAPLAIKVASADEARLQAFFKAMVKLQLPLMVLPTVLIAEGMATFSGSAYFRHKVSTPKRLRPTPTLEDLAKAKGLSLPSDAEALKALRSLHAQLGAKDAKVRDLLAKQDRISEQARILQFLRTKAKEIDSQTFPKRLKAPSGAAGTPSAPPAVKAPVKAP